MENRKSKNYNIWCREKSAFLRHPECVSRQVSEWERCFWCGHYILDSDGTMIAHSKSLFCEKISERSKIKLLYVICWELSKRAKKIIAQFKVTKQRFLH